MYIIFSIVIVHVHFRNHEITLNSQLKLIFNKPNLFPIFDLYNELGILNVRLLHKRNICLTLYNFKLDFKVPCFKYNSHMYH